MERDEVEPDSILLDNPTMTVDTSEADKFMELARAGLIGGPGGGGGGEIPCAAVQDAMEMRRSTRVNLQSAEPQAEAEKSEPV